MSLGPSRVVLSLLLLTAALSAQAPERAPGALELPSIEELLDRYRAGAFDSAVKPLSSAGDPEAFRASFIKGADTWVARAPADSVNRRFVAAALAVEVAHARLAHDNLSLIILLDWAVREWRKLPPSGLELIWTRAAVALVERGGQTRDLFPPPSVKDRRWGGTFLDNALRRFPNDSRLRLATVTWLPSPRVKRDFERLTADAIVGADALVQLAFLHFWSSDFESAQRDATRAVNLAAEPATQFMAHFILAFCHESKGRLQDAVREYSAALRAVPHAQSASIPLALLLLRDNQAGAAFDLIDRSLAERSDGDDPWRLFHYGSYARWPLLVADVRKAVS
jgi:tetratricopeptide (TPR) repeat protein